LGGSHTFDVRAKDEAGNTDATPDTRTWTVDTTAPDTTITGNPSNPSNSSSASFSSPTTGASFFVASTRVFCAPQVSGELQQPGRRQPHFYVRADQRQRRSVAGNLHLTIDTGRRIRSSTPVRRRQSARAPVSRSTPTEAGGTFQQLDAGVPAACSCLRPTAGSDWLRTPSRCAHHAAEHGRNAGQLHGTITGGTTYPLPASPS
jgi:hypothetical protein